ncbi:hypothetical protein [Streptomyces sp. ADI95-17]|uniref:hypothetical protein n=1 Tax=Streptomyces sp. ADI95-17 TaxID=1522759 RepID=UPI000FB589F4|nr:hypothetical protein [Streptomyces sp. ADI95-17]RPK74500.1 hypothetical protein EES42_08520 [Streptomyces sp. ADI95-17]
MTASTAAAALAALMGDAPAWVPPVNYWEIARDGERWIVSGQLDTDGDTLSESDAYRLLGPIVEQSGQQLDDDGRLIRARFAHFDVPCDVWFLRPVLRWVVPEQCATCPTKLGAPDVKFVRLGTRDRKAPVICVPCRDRMQAYWVALHRSPLVAARQEVRELLLAETGETRPMWRTIITDSESPTGVAPVCTTEGSDDEHHVLADHPSGPTRDDEGIYGCCPWPQIETDSAAVAAYLIELLNADAHVDAEGGESA